MQRVHFVLSEHCAVPTPAAGPLPQARTALRPQPRSTTATMATTTTPSSPRSRTRWTLCTSVRGAAAAAASAALPIGQRRLTAHQLSVCILPGWLKPLRPSWPARPCRPAPDTLYAIPQQRAHAPGSQLPVPHHLEQRLHDLHTEACGSGPGQGHLFRQPGCRQQVSPAGEHPQSAQPQYHIFLVLAQ